MQRFKTLISRLWLSISEVEFYQQVWDFSLRQSLLFFLGWMTIIGLLSSSYFATIQLPPLKAAAQDTVSQLPRHYPEDLQIFLSNGTLTLNRELLPLPLPESWLATTAINPEATPELLAVLAKGQHTPEEWQEQSGQNAIVFANQSNLYVNNFSNQDDLQWNQFPLEQLAPDAALLINSNNIEQRSNEFNQTINDLFPFVQMAAILTLTLVLIFSRLFVGIFETVFIFLLLKIYGKKVGFMSTLNFGLHLIVPAELINQVALYVWPNSPVSFLSLSFWILAIYILFTIRQNLPDAAEDAGESD